MVGKSHRADTSHSSGPSSVLPCTATNQGTCWADSSSTSSTCRPPLVQPQPQPQPQPLAQAPETRTSPRSWRSPGLNESQGLQGPRPTPLSPLSSCLPPPLPGTFGSSKQALFTRRIPLLPSLVRRATDGTKGSGRASLPKPMPCSSLYPPPTRPQLQTVCLPYRRKPMMLRQAFPAISVPAAGKD